MEPKGKKREITKEYTNGEISVVWKPHLCDHSALCMMGSPKVFDTSKRPWINMKAESSQDIIKTVDTCPTKALTYRYNQVQAEKAHAEALGKPAEIKVLPNGPILITGNVELKDCSGQFIKTEGPFALCRCGASKKKPFCDGQHLLSGFIG